MKIFTQEGSAGTFVCQSTLNVGSTVYSVAFSPDGSTLAAGCYQKIYFVDPTAGEIESSLNVDAGVFGVKSVSFSPKGDMVAAGCSNGNIFFVDAAAGEIKSSLTGSTGCDFQSTSTGCDFQSDL